MSALLLTDRIDLYRLDADRTLSDKSRADLGQFMTQSAIARFMASLFSNAQGNVLLLDPGAGVGSLSTAFVEEVCGRTVRPTSITAHAWELDKGLFEYLSTTLSDCAREAGQAGIHFDGQGHNADFVEEASTLLMDEGSLFPRAVRRYTHCIMNPPYRKIQNNSEHRAWLRRAGIETTNLYTGFLALAVLLLQPGGELVAIVPRSFCNGVYFKAFRRFFLSTMNIRQLHVFVARDQAFQDNDVLQENIIIHAIKGGQQGSVVISSSQNGDMDDLTHREVDFSQVVRPDDVDKVINIASSEIDQLVTERIHRFTCSLPTLGIQVSTGAVVDFRALDDIREMPEANSHPLIYPAHFKNGFVEWPKPGGRKPNAIIESESSRSTLMPNGWYVLTRRFSSKEEKRRIVAGIHSPERVPAAKVGFENHLNVFHTAGKGLDSMLARGLAVYLNSTLVDMYFRQFSGHTQVNASDLRTLPYPDRDALKRMATLVGDTFPSQDTIDKLIEAEINNMTTDAIPNPVNIQNRIREALELLADLGLPRAQRNERSALTLLALLDLKADEPWALARSPLVGITPIMEFAREHYGRQYAPNSRETFRRFTMHQFVQAGIATMNPDHPARPINSPGTVYQIESHALELIQAVGNKDWHERLASYSGVRESLAGYYAHAREMTMVPLTLPGGTLQLTPGDHNILIKAIVEEFGPRFAPGADVLYVGDTGAKMVYFDDKTFASLGLIFDQHGKFPDVILYMRDRNWLLLVESVTSHGPMDAKRHMELAKLFKASTAGLVYVTAFPDRSAMARYLNEISWETEVWVADAPTHLIHFNGERFLGPYIK
jgi:adenine-specific DNA-methyltransferase